MRIHLGLTLGVIAFCALPLAAGAQDYPVKPIRLVVTFPPGGPADIIGRVVGQKLQELFGQLVIIDNRAGAGGVVGADNIAKSEPDGYSAGIASAGALALSTVLLEKMPYDPLRDLALITLVAKVPEILVASTDLPVKNVADLVALARAHPGTINYASTGPESMPHLGAQMFRVRAGIDIVHVPYKGGGPSINDLIAGNVQMTFEATSVLLPLIKVGRLRAIAVTSAKRISELPEVPTMVESGYPGFVTTAWTGLLAPAHTPAPIIAKLNAAINDGLKTPQLQYALTNLSYEPMGGTPQDFTDMMKAEVARWSPIVKSLGLDHLAQ
jgi:tripartite-type tricarboxylate transporter receptor subunit TctC